MSEHSGCIALGDYVKDPISNFEGTVVSRTRFLHGCERCGVQAPVLDKDGKEHILHFDEAQLQVIEGGKHRPKATNRKMPLGGPPRISDNAVRPTGSSR
jgi:hypothetical protein